MLEQKRLNDKMRKVLCTMIKLLWEPDAAAVQAVHFGEGHGVMSLLPPPQQAYISITQRLLGAITSTVQ